jgi:very-short-patch-repair endonuclease
MTDSEARLWGRLRCQQIDGHHFRRQVPIGPYVADFVCLQARVVIEVDGGQHTPETDEKRTAWLESRGFRVLRFWNSDVLLQAEGVLDVIREACGRDPPPSPSPQGGGKVRNGTQPGRRGACNPATNDAAADRASLPAGFE